MLDLADGTYDLVGIFGIFTLLLLRYGMDYWRNGNGKGKAGNPSNKDLEIVMNKVLSQLKSLNAGGERIENILIRRNLGETLTTMNERLAVLMERTKE